MNGRTVIRTIRILGITTLNGVRRRMTTSVIIDPGLSRGLVVV
jgi:hypothetical protein